MMKKKITAYLLLSLMLLGLNSCTRNEMPVKQSTSKTKLDHLIIKEVFYVGHYWYRDVRAWGMKNMNQMYNDDQYITIFNPTDEVKYQCYRPKQSHSVRTERRFRQSLLWCIGYLLLPWQGQ